MTTVIDITASPYNCPTDGTSDCRPAFIAMKTAMQGADVQLILPTSTVLTFGQAFVSVEAWLFAGIRTLEVVGNGATLQRTPALGGFHLGAYIYPPAHPAGFSVFYLEENHGPSYWDPFSYAFIADVSAGATSVTITNHTELPFMFGVGNWCLINGFAIQATGLPPNTQFFDYVQITGISGNTITFTPALKNSYSAGWAQEDQGHADSPVGPGRGMIQRLDRSWDCDFHFHDFSIDQIEAQTYAAGRNILWERMTTSNGGIVPSFNGTATFKDSDFSNVFTETDKMVDSWIIDNTQIDHIQVQSSSVNDLIVRNGSFIHTLDGTTNRTVLTDSEFDNLGIGCASWGVSTSITITNCTVGAILSPGNAQTTSFNTITTMSGGIIRSPYALQGNNATLPPTFNYFWFNAQHGSLGNFQVNSSTWEEFPDQDWLYHTNLAGGFPAGFFSGGNLGVRAQPAKHLTVTNCVDAFSNPIFVGHPAGAPPYSYWQSSPKLNRATLGTAGVPGQTPTIWGKLRKLTIDVQVASTTTGLTFSCPPSNQSVANNTNNTITSFGTCNIDLTTPGKRVIQLSGNTGIQGSDSVPTLAYEPWIPDNLSFFASATPGGGDPLSVFVEIVTDQGGADVSPFSLSASTGAYVRFGVAAGFLLHSSNTPLAIGAGAYGLSGVPAGLSRSAPAGPPQVHFRHKRV